MLDLSAFAAVAAAEVQAARARGLYAVRWGKVNPDFVPPQREKRFAASVAEQRANNRRARYLSAIASGCDTYRALEQATGESHGSVSWMINALAKDKHIRRVRTPGKTTKISTSPAGEEWLEAHRKGIREGAQ